MCKAIVSNFSVDSILEEFQSKSSQKQGIKCSIKEILALPYPLVQTCANLLRELLTVLQQEVTAEDSVRFAQRMPQGEDSPQFSGEDRFESVDYQRESDEAA